MPIVAIRSALDVNAAVHDAVRAVGGLNDIINKGDRILIKPNLCVPKLHDTGATTNPAIVEELIKLIKSAGGEPLIGESPPLGVDGDACLEVTGIKAVADKWGIVAYNLEHDESIKIRIPRSKVLHQIRIARTALECDAIISVPVLKSHKYTGITCGLKNMKGVLPGREKSRLHRVGLSQAIADLNTIVLPDLVVVDGTIAMEGDAIAGRPVPLGLIVAGRDAVATDAVCARIAGLSVRETKHITFASELGLGIRDLRRIKLDGPPLREITHPFQKPWKKLSDLQNIGRECKVDLKVARACSGCIGLVLSAITKLKNQGQLESLKIKVFAIGSNARIPPKHSDYLIIGNCLSKFKDSPNYLPGCPPNIRSLLEKLNELDNNFQLPIGIHKN